jgi:phage baseplate assembly protein gpV
VNATVAVSGGNVTTTGNVAASGNVTATGAVAAGGISLGSHTHQAPSGGGTTTPPNQT